MSIIKRLRTIVTAAVAGATLLSLAACGASSANAGPTDQITVGLKQEPRSLDPAYNYEYATFPIVNQVSEGLLHYGKDSKLEPGLAEKWTKVDDTTYTYDIRKNVTFSDGTPLTADDVVYTLKRNQDPATASNVQWMFANVASIDKTGDNQVTVKLKQPDASWQYVPATPAGQIVSKKNVEEQGDNFGKPNGTVIGAGPYKIESWTSGSQIVLTRNDNYWDKSADLPIKTVNYKIITDENALALSARTGQVDLVINPTNDLIKQYQSGNNLKINVSPSLNNVLISFNTKKAPFDDPEVRKAVSYAIDAEGIRKNVAGEYGEQASALPFGEAGYTVGDAEQWKAYAKDLPLYSYDLDKAKAALAKSSKPDGFSTDLVVRPGFSAAAQAIQASLKELGIEVKLINPTNEEYYEYVYGSKLDANGIRQYDMSINGWNTDFPDPIGFLQPQYDSANAGAGGSNFAAYSSKSVDDLILKQASDADETARVKDLQAALSIAAEDAPYKVLFYPKNVVAVSNKFTYELPPMWIYNFFIKDIKVNS